MSTAARTPAYIFGAGTGGTKAFHFYRRHFDIVGFCDNDAIKQTQQLHGRPIVAPAKVVGAPGKVIIGSQYYPAISRQLMQAGVDPARIIVADPEVLDGLYLPSRGLQLALVGAVLVLAAAAYGVVKLFSA